MRFLLIPLLALSTAAPAVARTPSETTPCVRVGEILAKISATVSRNREIHVIADNLSAHETAKVEKFLSENPNVTLHFTPTYSSWLNQVELWFSKVERDVIARGIFTSAADLARKLRRYIDQYNKIATPFRWSYSDPTRRIA